MRSTTVAEPVVRNPKPKPPAHRDSGTAPRQPGQRTRVTRYVFHPRRSRAASLTQPPRNAWLGHRPNE